MESAINFFNIEIGVFLRYLQIFSNIDNVDINTRTEYLLENARTYIDRILKVANTVQTFENDDEFLFDLNERTYQFRRYILCRICNEEFGISRAELNAHVSDKHKASSKESFATTETRSTNELNEVAEVAEVAEVLSVLYDSCGDVSSTNVTNEDNFEHSTESFPMLENGECHDKAEPPIELLRNNEAKILFTDVLTGNVQAKYADAYNMNAVKNGDYKIVLSRLIRLRGLPWTATKKEIVQFFSGINILGGVSGIHFIPDDPNMVGVAYVQVGSKKDYDLAKGYHRKNLDGRYIDVLPGTKDDILLLNKHKNEPNKDTVLRVDGMPWTSSQADIEAFFEGISIDNIRMVLEQGTQSVLEAFVRFSTAVDCDKALKRNWEVYGKRHVKLFRSSNSQMKFRKDDINYEAKKDDTKPNPRGGSNKDPSIPKSEANLAAYMQKMSPFMVLARGFQWKVSKKDVLDFFAGVKVLNGEQGVNIIKNGAMEAYVELPSKAERKKALALTTRKVDSRIVYVTKVDGKEYTNVVSRIVEANTSKVIQIRGLPWSVDKQYIANLFRGLKFDANHGIQIETDDNGRRTGYAYVEFDTVDAYEQAMKRDIKTKDNQFLRMFVTTKDQFSRTVKLNQSLSKSLICPKSTTNARHLSKLNMSH